MNNKKHIEVVAAVIKKDDKFFCCQRGKKNECAFKWEFPGGKIEPGETREEALKREIKEEAISPIRFPPTAIAGVMVRFCDSKIR